MSDARYHARYFSYGVEPDDISDAELSRLIELRMEKTNLDNVVRHLAQTRLGILAERLSSAVDNLDLPSARNLSVALARIGDVLPTGVPMHDHPLVLNVGNLIARLANHLVFLQEREKSFTAPLVIEYAAPLPFALAVYRELERVEWLNQKKESPEGADPNYVSKHDWMQLQGILRGRIKADWQLRPAYDLYLPADAFRLLHFWRATDPNEERGCLEGRLREHPNEAIRVIGMFGDTEIN